MKKLMSVVFLFLLSSILLALDTGQKATDFTLPTAMEGKQIKLSEYKGKNVVLIFVATRCPYSNAFTRVMAQLARDYHSKGIFVLGINSNNTEPVQEVAQHAREHFPFPILKDDRSKVADLYGAQVTPEAFLIDSSGMIRYHGALGNSSSPTTDASQANSQEIRSALDEFLAGRPISKAKTKAFGCTIKRAA